MEQERILTNQEILDQQAEIRRQYEKEREQQRDRWKQTGVQGSLLVSERLRQARAAQIAQREGLQNAAKIANRLQIPPITTNKSPYLGEGEEKKVPAEPEIEKCPDCKCDISYYDYGIKKLNSWDVKGSACPTCSPIRIARRRRRHVARLRESFFHGSNIPPRMMGWTMDNYPGPKNILPSASTYLLALHKNILGQRCAFYIGGKKGVGKTSLLIAMTRHVIITGQEELALFLPARELFSWFYKSYARNSDIRSQDVMDLACEVPFLALDDMGEEPQVEDVRKKLGIIINYRFDHQLPTLLSSNLSIDDQQRAWRAATGAPIIGFHDGERLTDRLHEFCYEKVLVGPSLRKQED